MLEYVTRAETDPHFPAGGTQRGRNLLTIGGILCERMCMFMDSNGSVGIICRFQFQ